MYHNDHNWCITETVIIETQHRNNTVVILASLSYLFLRETRAEISGSLPASRRLRGCFLPPPAEASSRRNSRLRSLGSQQGRVGEVGDIPVLHRGESLSHCAGYASRDLLRCATNKRSCHDRSSRTSNIYLPVVRRIPRFPCDRALSRSVAIAPSHQAPHVVA